jgi:putative transposase
MSKATELPRRKSTHLRDYDYANPGYYFVTICTRDKRCLFGDVVDGVMRLSDTGVVVDARWRAIPNHFATVVLDQYVVMPNHVHGIVQLLSVGSGFQEGAMNRAPTVPTRHDAPGVGAQFIAPSYTPPTLGEIVRSFKARCTVALRVALAPASPIWQRNYHDHIIRSDTSLQAIREYIINNPKQWALDRENPRFSNLKA